MEKVINRLTTYSKEVVFEETLKYFKGDTLATDVWIKKYALKDSKGNLYEKSPEDMHRRIAKELARIESKYPNPLSEEEIFEYIKEFKYLIPGGSSSAGIGNDFVITSLSNCFVIGNDEKTDSYGGIMRIDEEIVQLSKRRGGVGTDISYIRPAGTSVKNSALTSTGIVPFMERYSNSIREVAQNGRRGALMISCDIEHPESENFMDAKMEQGKVTGANISLKIGDNFMESVKGDGKFTQSYPIGSKTPSVTKVIDSKKLFDKLIHNAWKSAEPGCLFWGTIIKESIPDCYADLGFKSISTNPCVTSDTWIMTSHGAKQVKDLINKPFVAIVDGKEYSCDTGFFYTGDKLVYEVETDGGLIFTTTDNHKIKQVLKYGRNKKETTWTELKDLKIGDYININNNTGVNFNSNFINNEYDNELGWLIGSLIGDGTLMNDKAYLRYWGENRSEMKSIAVDYLNKSLKHRSDFGSGSNDNKIITITSTGLKDFAEKLGLDTNKNLTNIIEEQSSDFYKGFISGIFDADGTVLDNIEKGVTVRLSSSNLHNLYIIKRMLLRIGINSKISKNRRNACYKMLPDGNGGLKEYMIKDQHELIVSKDNVIKFKDLIGFRDSLKQSKLEIALSKIKRGLYKDYFVDKITSIKLVGNKDVYDCTVNIIHEFDGNGVSLHNCGEIVLCDSDSCRLLSINLYSFVENPFTKEAKFNFDKFKKTVQVGERFMDDIVDLEIEKIDKILAKIDSDPESESIKSVEKNLWVRIKDKTIRGRRTGMGITAEGDMLAALGLTYGTGEATEFSVLVHKMLAINAYKSSCYMAQERGSFPIYDYNREINNPFIKRLCENDNELEELLKKGRRNIALLTIAPNGTLSMLTQTTSGIEPVFLPVYKRRRKINPTDVGKIKVDFIDELGDKWEEYVVIHHKFLDYLTINGFDVANLKNLSETELNELVKNSPYNKATSADVDWLEKVRMQGAIQKWVDHSISVTVNLPENTSEDVVRDLYLNAYECGCKGVTIYREGSRSGVLISDKKKEEVNKHSISETHAPKRPKRLECDVLRFNNNHEKWIGFTGVFGDDKKPYEIFTGLLESFTIPAYVEKGWIVKDKETGISRYDFNYIDKDGYEQSIKGLNRAFNPAYWNYARLISGVLRHGMPIPYVCDLVEGLHFEDALAVNSWKVGIKRMLKKYIKDGTEVSGHKCPDCGNTKLKFQDGCVSCDCGYSKCG